MGKLLPRWPMRYEYVSGTQALVCGDDLLCGYVVWRDVFEGDMKCSRIDAIQAHRVATFTTEAEAADYCRYRNDRTLNEGTDEV